MRVRFIPAVFLITVGLLMVKSAFAIDGTINFSGEITANTCNVKIDNSLNGSGTVTLPTVSTSAFTGVNSVAGMTAFNISLSGCSITKDTTVSAYFEPGAYTNNTGRLSQSHVSGATGVEIQLLNSSQGVMNLFAAQGSQNDVGTSMNIGATSAVLTYYAQYFSTGAVSAGPVTSQVSYSVVYD